MAQQLVVAKPSVSSQPDRQGTRSVTALQTIDYRARSRGAGVDESNEDVPIRATLAEVPGCSPVRMSMLI
jgi:hypothetical protein